MEVVRLLPGDDRSWPLMPEFWRRNKAFIEKYLPETNPIPVIDQRLRDWTQAPFLTGFFLVLDDGKLPFAHMTSWLAEGTGMQPYVFVYQAYCDKYSQLGDASSEVLKCVDQWAKALNAVAEAQGKSERVSQLEMSTWRDAKVWERYFAKMGRTGVKTRSVIRANLIL